MKRSRLIRSEQRSRKDLQFLLLRLLLELEPTAPLIPKRPVRCNPTLQYTFFTLLFLSDSVEDANEDVFTMPDEGNGENSDDKSEDRDKKKKVCFRNRRYSITPYYFFLAFVEKIFRNCNLIFFIKETTSSTCSVESRTRTTSSKRGS